MMEEYTSRLKRDMAKRGHRLDTPTVGLCIMLECKICKRQFRMWNTSFGTKYWYSGQAFDSIEDVPVCEKYQVMI